MQFMGNDMKKLCRVDDVTLAAARKSLHNSRKATRYGYLYSSLRFILGFSICCEPESNIRPG